MTARPPTVLHLPGSYPPHLWAGKEVYTHTLALALRDRGVRSEVAVSVDGVPGATVGRYEHDGVPVHVLPPLPGRGTRRTFLGKTQPSLPGFAEALEAVKPDVVHFHDQGGGAGLSHLRAVKAAGLPAVLTYHSPGQTCPRHDLMRFGDTPCDGEVRDRRCTACRLTVGGLPRAASELVALAEWPGGNDEGTGLLDRLRHARRGTRWFREALAEFAASADAVVVLADWCRDVWLRNGADPAKLHLVLTGGRADRPTGDGPKWPASGRLVVGYAGRCLAMKGPHLLVEAVRSLPRGRPVEVRLFGGGWDGDYGRRLLDLIRGDGRFLPPRTVPNEAMGRAVAELDALVVPSVVPETGPLTLFDAFAAGTPVIGSDLGGIGERVTHGVDGLLFPPGDAAALAAALRRCLDEPDLLPELRAGVRPPRTVADTAADMRGVYAAVCPAAFGRGDASAAALPAAA